MKTHPWRIIFFLWICGIFGAMQIAKMSVTFDEIILKLTINDVYAGFLLGAVSIVPMIFGFFSGTVFEKIGFKKVITLSLLIGSLLSFHQALESSSLLFTFSRVLEGFSLMGIVVSAPILIGSLSTPKSSAVAMSLWGTFFGFAFAVLGWLSPILIAWNGVEGVYLSHAAFMLTAALFALGIIPKDKKSQKTTDDIQRIYFKDIRQMFYETLIHLKKFRVVSSGIIFFIHTSLYTPILTFLAPLISQDKDQIKTIFVLSLVSIVGTIIAGPLSQWLGKPLVVMVMGFLGMVMSLLLLPLYIDFSQQGAFCVMCVLLFFSGIVQGTVFSSINYLVVNLDEAIASNSNVVQLGNIGSTLGPVVFAGVAIVGISSLIIGFLGLCIFGVIITTLMIRAAKSSKIRT